jgi:hypothetical protein
VGAARRTARSTWHGHWRARRANHYGA